MPILSRPRRPRRSSEWNSGKAVTFIVTLAATRSVTLAAREAGMSRKSAYALKSRDPAFAEAWKSALKARAAALPKGNEAEEVHATPVSLGQDDKATRAARSNSSAAQRYPPRPLHRHSELVSASMNSAANRSRHAENRLRRANLARDLFFTRLARRASGQ